MLSVCCINFSTVAIEARVAEEGPTAELDQRNHTVLNAAAALSV